MTRLIVLLGLVLTALLQPGHAPAADVADPSPASGVAEILANHDRALLADLKTYLKEHPGAEDLEQAYMVLFERAIENDWYLENEPEARSYLQERADGAVAPLARIVATMARAQDGEFSRALTDYEALMASLGGPDQEEFAANFADALARKATTAGEVAHARRTYEILLAKFGENPALRQRVEDDLRRLDMVGKPAPEIIVQDLEGKAFRLSDLKGKHVLVDFWATWCAPCLAELPEVRAVYDDYHARGFEIVGISLDESVRPLSDFVREQKLPWHQIHNATSGGDPVAAFRISSIPASFLIGPDGTILRLDPRGPALREALKGLIR